MTPTTVHLRHVILSHTYPGGLPLIRSASSLSAPGVSFRPTAELLW